MYTSNALTTTFLSLLSLATALPTTPPTELVPRCGTTILPVLHSISNKNPSQPAPLTTTFSVSTTVNPAPQPPTLVNTILTFPSIPANSYGCTIAYRIPSGTPVTITGNPTLNITTLGPTSAGYTWDSVYAQQPQPFTHGLFGTVNLAQGGEAVVNSMACPVGGGQLVFMAAIANWVWGSAGVEVAQQNGAGFYLTYNC